nr:hypothetical protein [Neorhizobium tomejilense]
MTTASFETAKVEQFVSSLLGSEHRAGDHQFWMARGAKLATALILTVCNSKDAETSRPDTLSFKFLSDILFPELDRYRPEDLSRLQNEARSIFHWVDEIYAGITSDAHASQADYVLQLYRNALPRNAILAHLVRDL